MFALFITQCSPNTVCIEDVLKIITNSQFKAGSETRSWYFSQKLDQGAELKNGNCVTNKMS